MNKIKNSTSYLGRFPVGVSATFLLYIKKNRLISDALRMSGNVDFYEERTDFHKFWHHGMVEVIIHTSKS